MQELILLIKNNNDVKQFLQEFKNKLNIKIISIEISEKKNLAYKIKNNTSGIFIKILFYKNNNTYLNKFFKTNKYLIRYLIKNI